MRKKMIEVAIPLDAINRESAREKSIRHGHPSTVHLWWARRPLAACRAVLFASLVDDPESDPANRKSDGTLDTEKASARRSELFALVADLVKWENANNATVLNLAKAEIAATYASVKVHDTKEWSTSDAICGVSVGAFLTRTAPSECVDALLAEHVPPVLDPFAGGGSIPLEAQRLGLRAYASDLNPVPVLINKALIEIPARYAGQPPINPVSREDHATGNGKQSKQKTLQKREWAGLEGLAEDVQYYGAWMREEAAKRIGDLYPQAVITDDLVRERPDLAPYAGQRLPVIAWLWARTVASPDPATSAAHVPLVKSLWLSKNKGKEAWAEIVVDKASNTYHFVANIGPPPAGHDPRKGTVSRTGAICILSGQAIPLTYIRAEGKAGRMRERLMAIVCEGQRGRIYLSPDALQEATAVVDVPPDAPDTRLPDQALGFRVQLYGMDSHAKLFFPRQLLTLSTFSQLVQDVYAKAVADGARVSVVDREGYAAAIATYLACVVDKLADLANALCAWEPLAQCPRHLFGKQTISMVWDVAEGNPFGESSGSWQVLLENLRRSFKSPLLTHSVTAKTMVTQADAASHQLEERVIYSTDPPYYDNIGYADLSDFFYVWLRKSLLPIYPDLLRTLLTPKTEELIAAPYRHEGDRDKAVTYFENGLGRVFENVNANQCDGYPVTVFYAFKQSEETELEAEEEDEDTQATSTVSTGWETMLEGLIKAGLRITGTWPIRTEMGSRMRGQGSNALASSIVLVCRPRAANAPITARRDFVAVLKRELPSALRDLQSGNIAPVDLAQAAIGPGMAVYSRYSKVLESSGERLTVRTALALINQVLDEVLAEQEGDYDADTRWSLKWFEQFAHDDGPFGDANTLATAMSIGINGLVETGIVQAKAGKVRLLKRTELMGGRPETWDPATDTDIVHWEVCQYLIHALDTKGEAGAAALLRRINARYPGASETARELAYRLYTICERKKWAQEAMAYNSLIVAWPEIVKLAQSSGSSGVESQTTMF
jgi:putative DNA methylase